jgi:starvation-inducible outer membrane lipoprotein
MSFTFATCERKRALEFLKKLYPSSVVEDTETSVKDLLDIIEADEIRVCDPDFHGGKIIQGKNWKDDTEARAYAALVKSGLLFI